MAEPEFALRRVTGSDIDVVVTLLEQNGLPTADVRSKPECFFVAEIEEATIGAGGLETYGSDGLLRSIVVDASHRERGFGSQLCHALEARARDDDVESLYLLTTTATAFFSTLGYEPIRRERPPPSILETCEFTELCPASATCMRKSLT